MVEKGIRARTLADAVGVNPRTVSNWTSRKHPTMPGHEDRAKLRRVLGNYEAAGGDPVEVAVRRSQLVDWRQDAVMSFYRRNLAEQRAERAG